MAELDDIARFPSPGVRLLREDDRIAVRKEVFGHMGSDQPISLNN
jgi:hypothetical protein